MSEYSASAFGFTPPLQSEAIAPSGGGLYAAGKQKRTMPVEFYSFDEPYLRRLVAGDPDTESHFVSYFSGLLRAKLQLRLRCAQDVEDLRQEVFLRVLQSLRGGPGLQHPGKLGAFVNAVCNHVVLEYFRSKSRTTQWDEGMPEPQEGGPDLEGKLLSEEACQQVRGVLNDLPPKDRGLLRAVFLEERDKDSVCKDYGVQRDYLRVLLHRARRRLREALTQPKIRAQQVFRTSGGAH